MKSLFRYISACVVVATVVSSCEFRDEVNRDPNTPIIITDPSSILTSSQVGYAYTYGGSFARYGGIITQQIAGFDRQMLNISRYNILVSETDDPWDNSYRILRNLNEVNRIAGTGSPHYVGTAQVMKALVLGTLTQNFGDVPYRQAMRAETILQPAFDSQEQVYGDVQMLLDSAIGNLKAENSNISPGANDQIFGGDLTQWVKFSYALKARYYLHTSTRPDRAGDINLVAQYADSALNYGGETFAGAGHRFIGESVGSEGPISQFQTQRGDLTVHRTIVDTLRAFRDPRFGILITVTGTDTVGYVPGSDEAYTTEFNFTADEQVYFLSYSELCFIRAEAAHRIGDNATAATWHNNGVAAALSEQGVTDPSAYIAARGSETDATITLQKIMTQKWLALWLNQETFADWRRTGIPNIQAPPGNVTGGVVPVRLPYPQKERNLNSANIPNLTNSNPILNPVWWDAN